MENIKSIKEANHLVCMLLKNKYGYPLAIEPVNEHRYIFVRYKDENILVLYKREHFLTYNREAEGGHGETINHDSLKFAIANHVKRIFIVYPDKSVYVISPYTIEAVGIQRTNELEQKDVVSFDMKHLIRFKLYDEEVSSINRTHQILV